MILEEGMVKLNFRRVEKDTTLVWDGRVILLALCVLREKRLDFRLWEHLAGSGSLTGMYLKN